MRMMGTDSHDFSGVRGGTHAILLSPTPPADPPLNIRRNRETLSPIGPVHAVNFPCGFDRTNPYEIAAGSFRRPAATINNFHPWTGRRLPVNAVDQVKCYLSLRLRRACLFELKIQLCRLTWFERRIIPEAFTAPFTTSCCLLRDPLNCNGRLHLFNVASIAGFCRFNPDIRALFPLASLTIPWIRNSRPMRTCDKKRDPNKTNTRFDKHNKGGNVANAQYPVGQFLCGQFACHLVSFGRAFGLPIRAASHVEKAFSGCDSPVGK